MMRWGPAARVALRLVAVPVGVYSGAVTMYVLALTAAASGRNLTPRPSPAGEGSGNERPVSAPAEEGNGDERAVAVPLPERGGDRGEVSFDIVIPAHNEVATLPRLLASLAALDYPRDRLRVHVIADNCTDGTAMVARTAGAIIHERRDLERIGKGYALELGIERVLALPGADDDGVVILDADSEVAPDVLRVLARYLAAGARAVQSYYSVRNIADSPVAMLRYVALCLYHYVRPLGRSRLGLSAGLRGNGMAFTRRVLATTGWHAYGLTEDVEQHFRLLERGVRVAFAPDAVVWAEMPTTLRVALSQNSRWERGRLQAFTREAPRFLRLGLRRRDPVALEAAVEQLVAPLSVCVGAAGLTTMLGLAVRSRGLLIAGLGSLLGQVLYVLWGLRLADAPPAAYRALVQAPRYVAWKVWLWGRVVVRAPTRWQRTAREAEEMREGLLRRESMVGQ